MAISFEHEWFNLDGPTAKLRKTYGAGAVEGLRVEDIAAKMQQDLFPLLERSNRMLLRNLQALRARRQTPAPSVTIGAAGQVNVAGQQVNEAQGQRGAGLTDARMLNDD